MSKKELLNEIMSILSKIKSDAILRCCYVFISDIAREDGDVNE